MEHPKFVSSVSSGENGYLLPKYDRIPKEASRKLEELSALQAGWDGEDARPIDEGAITAAVNAIEWLNGAFSHFTAPHIIPTFEGLLQLEWHDARRSLEIEYTSDGWSLLGVETANTGEPKYHAKLLPLTETADLGSFYSWFANSDLVWPS